jgi:activating signal cointegrator 1
LEVNAISLLQPWASAIAAGLKLVETRSWGTSCRGPLAIHASKGMKRDQREFVLRQSNEDLEYLTRIGIMDSYDLPLGVVVATCELVDIVQFNAETVQQFTDREKRWGNFEHGRFGFSLANVKRLETPIPASGKLGIWNWKQQ